MAVLLALAALLTTALLVSCQQGCITSTDEWVTLNSNPTFYCSSAAQYKWWQLSDPCKPDDATVLGAGGCDGASCTISNKTLRDMTSHVLCCTDASISTSFIRNTVVLCFNIRVCPEVTISVPSIAVAGSSVQILTFVTTTPRPALGGVNVTTHPPPAQVVPSDTVFQTPGASGNNFTFYHTVQLPISERTIIVVDVSGVDHGEMCSKDSSFTTPINLIQVNNTTTTQPTTNTPSTDPRTITPEGIEDNIPFAVHPASLAIGVAIGVIAIFVLIAIFVFFFMCVRYGCAYTREKNSLQFPNNTSRSDHPLLTVNGTPAVTPSTDVQRSLGQSSETPASTPTEDHNLLTQSSFTPSEPSPYQEIQFNGITTTSNPPGQSAPHTPPVGHAPCTLPVGHVPHSAPPVGAPPPPPSEHSATHVHKEALEYHTHGQAVHLHNNYNNGGVVV